MFQKNGTALYEQLVNKIEQEISSGKLAPGDRLPSENTLAEDNGIQTWVLGVECPQQEEFDTLVTDSWQIAVSFTEAVFTWEFYMNRVES